MCLELASLLNPDCTHTHTHIYTLHFIFFYLVYIYMSYFEFYRAFPLEKAFTFLNYHFPDS